MEADAEARQIQTRLRRLSAADAEQTGESLVELILRDQHWGLGGRTLVLLSKRDPRRPLPWTRLGIGSPVLLTEESADDDPGSRGVVSQRTVDRSKWP